MTDVVNLIRLKRGSENLSLRELEDIAMERFNSLDLLRGSRWSSETWQYLKKGKKIHFSLFGGNNMPPDLITLSKIYIVNKLWIQRLRDEPYSHNFIQALHDPFRIWGEMGVKELSQISQELYDKTIDYLREKYAEPEGYGNRLNQVIGFLNEHHLLNSNIDTKIIRKVLAKTDEQGRLLAKKQKMPLPELVKAIIHLKWAVEDDFDGSHKAVNDKLCILTQIFQYGLGLRVGEVLRLPQNPLVEMDGEMFFRVWTEKGTAPMARYVPRIWRPAIRDAVDEIQRLTKPYRKTAVDIEENGGVSFIDERIARAAAIKESLLSEKIQQLDTFLLAKSKEAESLWELRRSVDDLEDYELKSLGSILPVSASSKDAASLLRFYKSNQWMY